MSHKSGESAHDKPNTARFFTENRHISWVLLIGTIIWGWFGYASMPKRKDPDIPIRQAVALVSWPGASAEMMEERVTRPVEDTLGESSKVEKIESTTRAGVAVVTITVDKNIKDVPGALDEIWLKLDTMDGLPDGASLQFIKDFGDTTALMLTVASPRSGPVELQMRAEAIAKAVQSVRSSARVDPAGVASRAALVVSFPFALEADELKAVHAELAAWATERGAEDVRTFQGPGFVGIDALTVAADDKILKNASSFVSERLRAADLHPDVWQPFVVRDLAETERLLTAVAGEKYTYRELDDYTDQIESALRGVAEVSKVSRAGVLGDAVYVEYSQEKLASYSLTPTMIENLISARNVVARGGMVDVQGKSVLVAPAGEIASEDELGAIAVARGETGAPVYLRDVARISRAYESPQYLAYATWRDEEGTWQRTRAISVAINMRSGLQIADFGKAVESKLDEIRPLLPSDIVLSRVSDQPEQVRENVDLFMSSLYEAIALVVLVALIGFWEWRSALLMALSIPITLAMTFGMMRLLGIDVQQISIASLIIALGLLVDDPVVAGDAIKRELAHGTKRIIAAWLGPVKLGRAILFATITNIVAYLPFLTLTGDTGKFIYSLPIVLTCSLVASRLVSMTFIPLLGYYLLRPPSKPEPSAEERRTKGLSRHYYRAVAAVIHHRWISLAVAVLFLAGGAREITRVKTAFFPKDLSYLATVDVWLPEDAPATATRDAAAETDRIIRETLEKTHPKALASVTTFIGGGGPRFWFSIAPEQRQSNYAQLVLRMTDKHETAEIAAVLQHALASSVPGARIDVKELESGPPVGMPVSIRLAGDDPETLRHLALEVRNVLDAAPMLDRVRESWGTDNLGVKLAVDPDRANVAGVTNADVAASSASALNGRIVGSLHEGDHALPIVTRVWGPERERLDDVEDLYVYSTQNGERIPLRQIGQLELDRSQAKILRRNHVRTITVGGYPVDGVLPSEAINAVAPKLEALRASMPPGYTLEVGGEQEEQKKSFAELVVVLLVSVGAIFIALLLQFRSAVKPLIVFAAIPFGVVASLVGLRVMGAAFGFMAFLGVISLIGVIVSHVIVLFDFIEEKREEGAPLLDALLDAGLLRLRPVLVTVLATVLGLVPLAMHGGPLWEPLCYVQVAGLTFATVVTLVLVPVLYAIFVLDLRLVKWSRDDEEHAEAPTLPSTSTQVA